jgi:hypothetical protein
MKRRAFTILEITMYTALVLVAFLAISGLYTLARRSQDSSNSSILISGPAEVALANLRHELEQTALASVVAYPNPNSPNEAPGVAFASALNGKMDVNAYGVPRWNHHVFYTLVSSGDLGKLVRWDQPFATMDFLPQLPTAMPSSQATKPRTVLDHLVSPNAAVLGLLDKPDYKADGFGGLRVQFITRTGGEGGPQALTSVNPSKNQARAADITRLLEVELKICQRSTMGKPDFFIIRFHVAPAY